MIPLLITQTWKSADLPPSARAFAEGWRRHNPDMAYRLFDDDACAALMRDAFPEHLDRYLQLPYPVMRADVFRYAVIHRDGGLYADIDMECTRPVGDLLSGAAGTLLATEARLTERRQAELGYPRPYQIANCIFAGRAGAPFFKAAVDRAMALCAARATIDRGDIEDLTGPRMLTRLFYEASWPDITVLRQIALMAPLHYPDVWPLNANIHARHHCFGGWKAATTKPLSRLWIERDKWPNPFPASLVDESLSGADGSARGVLR